MDEAKIKAILNGDRSDCLSCDAREFAMFYGKVDTSLMVMTPTIEANARKPMTKRMTALSFGSVALIGLTFFSLGARDSLTY